ncbi:histidine phosphatase family protein [Longispora sp. K20-0274]|uniref:histidine phosphatase family protein n=1 Tax=Longispora sp. K20-0274 TaxID=3088255 RepID=UPI00399BF586
MLERVRLVCLRHGQAENNVARTLGALPSAALTPDGRLQAEAAARQWHGEPVSRVYASTAVRARQTAEYFGRDVHPVPELVEVGIGAGVDGTAAEARAAAAETLRAWVVDRALDERYLGGETGREVAGRVGSALAAIAAAHPGGTVVVVGHVASLTVGLGVLCGLGAEIWGRPLPHAVPFVVERTAGQWRCPAWPA